MFGFPPEGILHSATGWCVPADTDDENIFFLVEEWQQQRHLDDHMKSSLFAALLGIKGLLTKEPEIKFMAEN